MSEHPKRKSVHSKIVKLSESRGKVEQPAGQFEDLFKKGTDKGNNKGNNQPPKTPSSSQRG